MKEITVAAGRFDFDLLVEKAIQFAPKVLSMEFMEYAIAYVDKPGDEALNDVKCTKAGNLTKLLNKGKSLFVMFSGTNALEYVTCADGRRRKIKPEGGPHIGDADCAGYLIQHKGGSWIINTAINGGGSCSGPGSVDVELDCGSFDIAMDKYIRKFIKDE